MKTLFSHMELGLTKVPREYMSNPDRFTFCKFPDAATGLCAND